MAQYVKFLRGTPEAFAKLKHKDNDTLYFIYEEDELNGELYLGSKLIAGADCSCDESSTNTLAGLRDVLLGENIDYESLLVYDSNAAAWINKPLEDLIFMGATEHSAGIVGLVPAPKLGQVDLFLRSDGTWAAPTNSNHFILTIENKDHNSHKDLINSMLDNIDPSIGDIIIIKDLIFNNKWQHTAYVYDNNVWKAMDGNYNAENIYFDEDLVTTTAIGNITLENGLAVISTAGKNLKEVFETIFVKEEIPEVVLPKIVLNSNEAKQYEVGEKVKLSYNAQLDPGSYSFGPDTNV